MATNVDAAKARQDLQSWWHSYRKELDAGYLELIAAEADASKIVHFHPIFIPGLLQTPSYADAITPATTSKALTPEKVATLVEVRTSRQRTVLGSTAPTELLFILDENSLRRPVGPPSTMRAQLDHLISMNSHPAVTLIVIPLDAEPHPGLLGAFMLMQFSGAHFDDVLCFEGPLGNSVLRHRPDLVHAYARLVDHLIVIGLHGSSAVRSIGAARDEFD